MRKLKNEELDRLSTEEFRKAEKTPVIIVLDNVRSMHNVGSVFRTCDAFRLQGLYLCGITARPPDREINKTALGATETVEWKYFSATLDAVNELKTSGYRVFAVEQAEHATQLDQLTLDHAPLAVIFGNEVKGVDQEVIDACDGVIEIPQAGSKHSLNIAVSAGIVCWELFCALRKKA
jgi:23S rRNA (guanosine2251-2'-O)-methyltransferase